MSVEEDLIQLGELAKQFAPLYTEDNRPSWNELCNLIANELTTVFSTTINKVRVFVLDCDTGDDSATVWPVVAQNDNPKIKTNENPISRPELLNASSITTLDYAEGKIYSWIGYRKSTSTETINSYATSQIRDRYNTTDFVLKLAISE